ALDNLKRVWKIHRARHTRHIALELRITIEPIGGVLALPHGSPWLVRNLVAFHYSQTGRHPTNRTECHHWRREDRNIGIHSWLGDHRTRDVSLEIPIRGRVCLPYSGKVRFRCLRRSRHHYKRSAHHGGHKKEHSSGMFHRLASRARSSLH